MICFLGEGQNHVSEGRQDDHYSNDTCKKKRVDEKKMRSWKMTEHIIIEVEESIEKLFKQTI